MRIINTIISSGYPGSNKGRHYETHCGDYFKGLYWDGTGMWLIAKRLEKGRFVWPPIVDGSMTLTPAQFAILVEAMDWRRTIAPPPPAQPMLV
jgi:transposase